MRTKERAPSTPTPPYGPGKASPRPRPPLPTGVPSTAEPPLGGFQDHVEVGLRKSREEDTPKFICYPRDRLRRRRDESDKVTMMREKYDSHVKRIVDKYKNVTGLWYVNADLYFSPTSGRQKCWRTTTRQTWPCGGNGLISRKKSAIARAPHILKPSGK